MEAKGPVVEQVARAVQGRHHFWRRREEESRLLAEETRRREEAQRQLKQLQAELARLKSPTA
jgi:hypothetical protein